MSDKILILGGNGLVGSSFDFGKKVTRKDADLTDLQETISLIEREKPDWVINCAGFVGGVQANMDFKLSFFSQNMLINMNVIEACMINDVPNVISFLSTCIFPDAIARLQPLKEEDLHEGEPHQSNYAYAYSKRMIDVLSRIAREKGLNYCCLIPTNIYGSNDNYNLQSSHIIPALIRKFYEAFAEAKKTGNKQVVEIWGTGRPIREFIYANDIPKIVKYIIEDEDVCFDNLILSNHVPYSIKSVVDTIKEIYDSKYPELSELISFEFNPSKPDGQFAKRTNSKKYKSLIPLELTSLKDGLIETIDFFIDTYENNIEKLKL